MKNITHNDLMVACLSFMAMGQTATNPAAIVDRAKLVHDWIGETDTAPTDIIGHKEINGKRFEILRDGTEREV